MRKMLLCAGAAFAMVGLTHAQATQPNPYQSKDMPLGAFDRVEVAGPFKVAVLVSDGPAHARLSGPPALLADTITKIEGDTLTIRFREGAGWSWNPGSGVNVFVAAPKLVSARVRGAAQVEIDQVRGESFSAATDGSGTIALRGLDTSRVLFATGGSGGITAEGSAHQGTYSVGGAGSIYADVSRMANVAVGGSGRVDVVGGATCTKQPVDSGRIECR
jgi:hypothetical protein